MNDAEEIAVDADPADPDATDDEPTVEVADADAGPDADANASADAEREDAHLQDVDDGCGCAEVWEHLSEQRQAAGDD